MGKKPTQQKKKLPPAPLGGNTVAPKAKKNTTFEKKPRNFRIGGDIQPKRDLTRFTKWPKFVRLQRQKRILLQRLKVPSTIAQFQQTLTKTQFTQLARLLKKLQPETKAEKKLRLKETAAAGKAGADSASKALPVLKFGINHVTSLIEDKKAKLVIMPHDVDPIELNCWMPALCRKKDVPYCFVKGKSRLGKLVHKKTASCLAITSVKKEDVAELNQICENMKAQYNDNKEAYRKMGGGIMGVKSQHIMRRRQQLLEKEQAKKTGLLG